MKRMLLGVVFGLLPAAGLATGADPGLIAHGGFEEADGARPRGWHGLWTRTAHAGTLTFDTQERHEGRQSARIEHRGAEDWSLTPEGRLAVEAGEILELSAWVRVRGEGRTTLGFITYAAADRVVDWSAGGRTQEGRADWIHLRSRLMVPVGVVSVQPRVIGDGPATVWVDDFRVVRQGRLRDLQSPDLPAAVSATNAALIVEFRTADGTLAVTDRRTGRRWEQAPVARQGLVVEAKTSEAGIDATWLSVDRDLRVALSLRLADRAPELTVSLTGDGALASPIVYPEPFVTGPGTWLVVPMNEGISYPVDDPQISPMRLVAYGGHGICMAFWGVTDGAAGQMAIIETPDDASIRIGRHDDRLFVVPEWDPQKGRFGYERRLRYVFFDEGGHVAMAKRYRAHAQAQGRLVTLAQKRRANPRVDLLVGAANVWNMGGGDPVALVEELREAGIRRILWSAGGPSNKVEELNAIEGVLTSRYDIYQDLMDPQVVKDKLRGSHGDWTQGGWPDDLMRNARGDWVRGWEVTGRDGQRYPCGVLCDSRAVEYARRRVPADLKNRPLRCRFIDTTTASPWRECYDARHPMTRSDSREWKMRLLEFMSKDMGLVTGSETGHDAAVPYVHYFEGMLSLGPYRVPDAGRNMLQVVDPPPERVARYQLGHRFRLPLWELVYHDCVVAQWYWGDYNNKLPALWDKRDLFNVLYATPPMFMFNREIWERNRDRFARSYRAIEPAARGAGYAEMTEHRFLTPDRDVQETAFANGMVITVNFGDRPYRGPNGTELAAGAFRIREP